MTSHAELYSELQRYWGYSSFRPLQREVVESLLSGRDVCVVMPTGGGKSLCYQLPAAMQQGRTAIVVSPLIALMHDQVAQLEQMGIAAALLNSSQSQSSQAKTLRDARLGKYKLLYLSPERLARGDSLEWLRALPISYFVIDEAHCISEWGHEFRTEYRELHSLRKHFPDVPIAAFTASAPRQVRHDIVEQLQLRDADKYIASFQRPNLRYHVKKCASNTQPELLLRAVKEYGGSNIIIYAPTIKRVEETVTFLNLNGISSVAYHAKLDGGTRKRNQERWMSDEVRVLVGTIAFGMGINKAAVRAVIHLSLPKSIEQYYQEAGRAGRDGEPADCVLLWQGQDAGLLGHFIGQIGDPIEKSRAWTRYGIIRKFVESKSCRNRQICEHFGETPKWSSCGACDICVGELGWLAAPATGKRRKTKAKKIRVVATTPAVVGGSATSQVSYIRPELARERLISQSSNIYSRTAVENIQLAPQANLSLREHLREWRKSVSREQNIAAFIVMHDTTLDELCRVRPGTLAELRKVSGFGERKVEKYGQQILAALKSFASRRAEH
jgi:ATP-dependent DNA helicase RecQ